MKYHSDPEVKTCQVLINGKPHGVPFTRPPKMGNGNWKQCNRCPECRLKFKKTRTKQAEESASGKYEVNHPVIDYFIYHMNAQEAT